MGVVISRLNSYIMYTVHLEESRMTGKINFAVFPSNNIIIY